MARKVRFHPSVMPISGGEPMDGDMAPDDRNYTHEDEHEDDAPDEGRRASNGDDRLERMEAELERLREENSLIKRAIPPAEPVSAQPSQDEIDAMSDEDFDALLFSNPREALRLHGEKLKRDLRNEYTTNQGTNKFWENFYAANADLKDDDDLVQSTLNKNMPELGNMPVAAAMDRLAALTRDRILGFMKKRKEPRTGNRAVTEGANPPSIPVAEPDDGSGRETTMGDLLRSRKAARRKAAMAA